MEEFIQELKCLICEFNQSDEKERYDQSNALENILEYIDKLEEKVMYALSPTNHELSIETKRNFKKIIMKNIDEDTYTIKRELKNYWNNMDIYWLGGKLL